MNMDKDDPSVVGIILDRAHEHVVATIVRETQNEGMVRMLARWRRSAEAYVIVAGDPCRRKGGIFGALAGNADAAMVGFAYAIDRFNELAGEHAAFTSAWMIYADEEIKRRAAGIIANRQKTEGTA